MSELLGIIFKEFRYDSRLTLRECAELTGLSNPFLSQFERGHVNISLDNAVKILILIIAAKEAP